MAAIIFGNKQTTDQTSAGATWETTGAALASGNFTAGQKYLICAQGFFQSSTTNQEAGFRIVEDASGAVLPNANSALRWRQRGTERNWWPPVIFEWTAVSGNGLRIEFNNPAATGTVTLVESTLASVAVDGLAAADYGYAQVSATHDLTTTKTTRASLTKDLTGDLWLIGWCLIADNDEGATVSLQWDMARTGTETETLSYSQRGNLATDVFSVCGIVAKAMSAASNQIDVKPGLAAGGASADWSHEFSCVFALNLTNVVEDVNATRTVGTVTLSPVDTMVELASHSHTVTATGDVLMLGGAQRDVGTSVSAVEMRFFDNADSVSTPLTAEGAGVTSHASEHASDIMADFVVDFRSMSSTRTIDLDARDNRQADATEGHRHLVTLSFEEKAAPAGIPPGLIGIEGAMGGLQIDGGMIR